MENTKSNKKVVVAAILLVILLAAAAILYGVFAPKVMAGSKSITVTVVDNNGEERTYEHRTDAEYLRPAAEEIEGLVIEGEEGEYGLFIKSVNGLTADYDTDGAYWSLYVNDEYAQYSMDQQPVTDGDDFAIKYEVAQ